MYIDRSKIAPKLRTDIVEFHSSLNSVSEEAANEE